MPLYVSPSTLTEQAQRQMMTYWRVRVAKILEHLESEVRRMLRVEQTLEKFAAEMVERLHPFTMMMREMDPQAIEQLALPKAPFEWVAQNVGAARQRELKNRYRQLAKELHPDTASDEGDRPSMAEINHAYAMEDLAKLVRLEAQALMPDMTQPVSALEDYVRQVDQAAATYRKAYTSLLNSPLYALYARAASAQEDGWDFIESLARRIRRAVEASTQVAA